MKVSLRTHGGFAAALPRPPLVVDSADLAPEAAERLRLLLEQAFQEDPGARPPTSGDAQTYVISVEGDGASRDLRSSDLERRPAFEALSDFLTSQKA
jgi:hypothetical protein